MLFKHRSLTDPSVYVVFCLSFVNENTDYHQSIHFSKKTRRLGARESLISENTGQGGGRDPKSMIFPEVLCQ